MLRSSFSLRALRVPPSSFGSFSLSLAKQPAAASSTILRVSGQIARGAPTRSISINTSTCSRTAFSSRTQLRQMQATTVRWSPPVVRAVASSSMLAGHLLWDASVTPSHAHSSSRLYMTCTLVRGQTVMALSDNLYFILL